MTGRTSTRVWLKSSTSKLQRQETYRSGPLAGVYSCALPATLGRFDRAQAGHGVLLITADFASLTLVENDELPPDAPEAVRQLQPNAEINITGHLARAPGPLIRQRLAAAALAQRYFGGGRLYNLDPRCIRNDSAKRFASV